jgi:DNA polymerase V
MYALVDCNNFYVSCERVFNPKLNNRPVIVFSNNDGCAVSRSNEVKKLGIAMGAPLFQIRDLVREHNITILSSNFALYGDLSARVMSIIMQAMPQVAIYSIDEAFIDLTTMRNSFDIYQLCIDLVKKIERYTGIPVSIGIAPTKTLAKVANHVAKKQNIAGRVFYLDSEQKTNQILTDFKIRDIWGIGRQLEKKLLAMGVFTAAELISLPEPTIKTAFNIVMRRTITELQGESSIELQDSATNKQQIMISRSFGHRVTELSELQEALATYASMACEKLRNQGSVAGGFVVFMHTGLHGQTDTVYQNSLYVKLPSPCADTRTIIHAAKRALAQLFRLNFRYQKVGIILCDLSNADSMQIDLFGHNNLIHSENLMGVMDEINHKLGRATVQFAAAGLDKSWKMQASRKSRSFTSSWDELPIVRL